MGLRLRQFPRTTFGSFLQVLARYFRVQVILLLLTVTCGVKGPRGSQSAAQPTTQKAWSLVLRVSILSPRQWQSSGDFLPPQPSAALQLGSAPKRQELVRSEKRKEGDLATHLPSSNSKFPSAARGIPGDASDLAACMRLLPSSGRFRRFAKCFAPHGLQSSPVPPSVQAIIGIPEKLSWPRQKYSCSNFGLTTQNSR